MSEYSNLKINILAIIACLLWATPFVVIKIGMQYTEPIQFAGVRFFIAGLLIFPFIKDKKNILSILKQNTGFIIKVAIFQTFLQYAFFYLGIARVSGSLSAIIIGAGPLFIAVMAHFLMPNDKISSKKALGIIGGFLGIILVAFSKNGNDNQSSVILLGILFLILANINGGYTNIFIAKNRKSIPTLVLSSLSLSIGGIMLTLFSTLIEPFEISIKPTEYYISLLWLSFVSAGAISIWTALLHNKNVVVSTLNMWKFIIPVFGAVLAWLVFP
ncbi:MAG: DMT family transporter, partial [Flavobacteriales bacterium]|nr:DMT family transporter [Flavobacteriales bacterium]